MGIIGPVGGITAAMRKGFAAGFVVKYSSTTAVAITSGNFEANRKFYTLAADTTHNMTSLAAGFDFHYIYVDDSGSATPVPAFIDSTTEPAWDHVKRGWYNGDDRLIGVIHSPPGSAIVDIFSSAKISEGLIRNNMKLEAAYGRIALNMNPDGLWQTPNEFESSVYVPINATEISINGAGVDSAATTRFSWLNSEEAAISTVIALVRTTVFEYVNAYSSMWGPLGASRNIKVGGDADDDNFLTAFVTGYGYSR